MKKVYHVPQINADACIGDRVCENACPSGAITMLNRKAAVDETRCVACLRCLDVCAEGAIRIVRRSEPRVCRVSTDDVDPAELAALCRRAHLDPEEPVCLCTMTLAGEVAAAILKGAHTPEQVTAGTGARSSCAMWCMATILRLLRAHGIDPKPPAGYRWYPADAALWDVPEFVASKHPEYHLADDLRMHGEGLLPNMINLLKK